MCTCVLFMSTAERLLQGISPLACCQDLLADPLTGTDSNDSQRESGTGWRKQRTKRWGLKRTRKGEREGGREEVEEREEGHEVRWKRSDLTAGENSSLQRSHKGLTQPLNTRHVSRCATHKPPKRYLFVSVALSYTHINCTQSTLWLASAHSLPLHIKMMTVDALNLAFSLLTASSQCTWGRVHL